MVSLIRKRWLVVVVWGMTIGSDIILHNIMNCKANTEFRFERGRMVVVCNFTPCMVILSCFFALHYRPFKSEKEVLVIQLSHHRLAADMDSTES